MIRLAITRDGERLLVLVSAEHPRRGYVRAGGRLAYVLSEREEAEARAMLAEVAA